MPAHPADDHRWMGRAFELARRAEGLTRPNPPVGAVVVKNGRIVGEGYHRRAGGPHAEVVALRRAGARARGATLYVTLEPCCTWGRTPPCTDAIASHGIRRVVVSVRDPNPRHAGRGLRKLRARGVRVEEGVCACEGQRLLAPFARWITSGRPFVTLKLGQTLDGRIADETGRSRWITGDAARRYVHALRRRVDAVMVGGGTTRLDNPSLLPIPSRGRKPWRVIVSASGQIPMQSRVLSDGRQAQTLLATTAACPTSRRQRLQKRGIHVLTLRRRGGGVDPDALLKTLGGMGVLHVLCEGGGELAGALLRGRHVDEFLFFIAPRVLGARAVPAIGGAGWKLAAAPHLRFGDIVRVGEDVLVCAHRED